MAKQTRLAKKAAPKKTAKAAASDCISCLLEEARLKFKDPTIQKIVLRKKTDALDPEIKKFNKGIQGHPKLKGFEFHAFQNAAGVALHETQDVCCNKHTHHCGPDEC